MQGMLVTHKAIDRKFIDTFRHVSYGETIEDKIARAQKLGLFVKVVRGTVRASDQYRLVQTYPTVRYGDLWHIDAPEMSIPGHDYTFDGKKFKLVHEELIAGNAHVPSTLVVIGIADEDQPEGDEKRPAEEDRPQD